MARRGAGAARRWCAVRLQTRKEKVRESTTQLARKLTPAFRKPIAIISYASLSLSHTHTHFDRTHGLPTVVLARFLLVPEVSAALALAGLVVMVLEEQLRPCKQPPTLLYHGLAGPDPSLPVCPVPKAAKGLTATIGLASWATAPWS
jgi:hypothetical protein